MQNQTFKEVMATLAETYGRKVTGLTATLYWNALKQYNDEEVKRAMLDYISDTDVCQFWPQPGALIAKIIGTRKQLESVARSESEQAWGKVYEASKNWRNPPDFNEKIKRALTTVGGLYSIGMCDDKQREFKRRDFISAYTNSELSAGVPTAIMDKSEAKAALGNLQARLGSTSNEK